MLRWGWDAWMQGPQAERVGLSRRSCVRCSRVGCYGRGEATHRNVNWKKCSCRSMHHGRDVDLDLEDVRTGVDEPPEKKRRAKK